MGDNERRGDCRRGKDGLFYGDDVDPTLRRNILKKPKHYNNTINYNLPSVTKRTSNFGCKICGLTGLRVA